MSNLIGKPVKNESGREIGKVLSFLVNSQGQMNEVLIGKEGGEYLCYPAEGLEFNNDYATVISEVDKKAKALSYEVPLIWRKKRTLNRLRDSNKILPEIYENLCAEFDATLNKLRSDVQSLLNDIDKQITNYEKQFRMLHIAKTFLEIEHEIGNVGEESYQQSLSAILRGLEETFNKKQSFQEMKEILSNILLNEESSENMALNSRENSKESLEASIAKSQGDSVITVHVK